MSALGSASPSDLFPWDTAAARVATRLQTLARWSHALEHAGSRRNAAANINSIEGLPITAISIGGGIKRFMQLIETRTMLAEYEGFWRKLGYSNVHVDNTLTSSGAWVTLDASLFALPNKQTFFAKARLISMSRLVKNLAAVPSMSSRRKRRDQWLEHLRATEYFIRVEDKAAVDDDDAEFGPRMIVFYRVTQAPVC